MKISEKFDLILSGQHLPAQTLKDPGEAGHTTVVSRGRAAYYFEEGSFVQSPWRIGKSRAINNFIGRLSYINSGGFARSRLMIGRYCSIGQRVSLVAGTHPMFQVSTCNALAKHTSPYSPEEKAALRMNERSNITIVENDVWSGDGAVIMPGVRIATGSVIAANAVVLKNVEAYSVVGGVPARQLRTRFPKEIAQALLASEWWEYPPEVLAAAPTDNVFEFMDYISRSALPGHDFATYRM